MICKKCGAEMPDGSVFCGSCGTRIDGKKVCSSCGALNREEYAFCTACGARIDGKKQCAECGTVFEGTFCPACGQKSEQPQPVQRQKKSGNLFVWHVVSGASGMAGVLFALIFVFFLGVSYIGETLAGQDIFYYFGSYYQEMDALNFDQLNATPWMLQLLQGQATAYGVIGTVLCALILISVVAFATVATVKYILGWIKKTYENATGWALACIFSFLIGAVVYSLYSSEKLGMDVKTVLNGATVAGLVLCAIAILSCVASAIAEKGKEFWQGAKGKTFICTAVCTVLASVLFIFTQHSAYYVNVSSNVATVFGNSNYLGFAVGMDYSLAATLSSGYSEYAEITAQLSGLNAFALLAQLLSVGMAIFAGLSLRAQLVGTVKQTKGALLWAIGATVCAAAVLVFSILMHVSLAEILSLFAQGDRETVLESNFAVQICTLIFAVLLVIGSAARSSFAKKIA